MKKICTKCDHELTAETDFYRHRETADGFLAWCKACHKADCVARHAHRYATEPEYRQRHDEYTRARRQSREYRKLYLARRRAEYWRLRAEELKRQAVSQKS